ncbi:MAG: hypothetical protein QNJ90_07170 [Planctomycetota bacterium]|nr:hypothetical protein [Planctomycetota bacterium]
MLRTTALLLLVLAAAPAWADERVPPVADRDLPVVGTCAPIQAQNVSVVTVGKRTEVSWFHVSGVAQPVDFQGLIAVLKQRAGTARPSPHGVWISASAQHAWIHAKRVREAAAAAGIYRIGLRVRSQATGRVMGFPLFLPPGRTGTPGPKAGLLEMRINTVAAGTRKASSDPGHAYAAVRRAIEKRATFGVQKVVASVWIATNAPLQYALTTLDLLYRAGVSGVKLRSGMHVPRLTATPVTVLEIQGGVASRLPQSLQPQPVMPRDRPWGLLGASEPGWVDFVSEKLPALDGAGPAPKAGPRPEPNYAAQPSGVPGQVWRSADGRARAWMQKLGADLLAGIRGTTNLKERFAIGLRRKEVLPTYTTPVRQAFPDATSVVPSTVLFNTLLFNKGRLVGRADVTLLVVGDRMRLIFGKWTPESGGAAGTLVPFAVDPFAAGDGALFRVWFEALFDVTKRYGLRGIPTADAAAVLPYFPQLAHRSVGAAIARRDGDVQALAGGLAGATWDRVVLSVNRGTATVLAGRQVIGVLNFSLRAEEGQLRLNDLKARRAK